MVRPRHSNPTPAELEILQIIWERGPSTVREVMEVLNRHRPRAYTTVMSLMNVMEEKNLLTSKPQGRAFVYAAKTSRKKAQKDLLGDLLNRAFDGSANELVTNLLDQAKPTQAELDQISDVIAQYKQSGRDAS
jgi:BlaI family transcriptional regulator, penicillinase repressor